MDDDRTNLLSVLIRELQSELDRELEIKLNGGALVRPVEGVRDVNICDMAVSLD